MTEGGSQPRLTAESGPAALTSAEYQIATLIGRGLDTRAIAAELFISPASVSRHVANLVAKLGLESRPQIAAWVETGSEHATR